MDIWGLLPFLFFLIIFLIAFIAYQRGRKPKEPKAEEEVAKERRWKEFLAERSETILDGVFGLVLGLGAYSLTGFTIAGISDVIVAISYFALMFLLICLFWWHTSKWFAVAEYNDALMAVNLFFIVLLILMPFSLRMLFIPGSEVRNVGMTLFPLVMGALVLGVFLTDTIVLRQKHEIPGEVRRDLKRGLIVFPVMSVFFFLSLLIPADAITQTYIQAYLPQIATIVPETLKDYPFRVASWWFITMLFVMLGGLAQLVHERYAWASGSEAPSSKEWRKSLSNKSRIISDSVYGLALGLSAFSLTDYALGGMEDIILALSFFILTFGLIFTFWVELLRCFALVPFFDDALIAINLLLTFFVTLMPFAIRLVMVPDVAVQNLGMTLFPLNLVAAGLSGSVFIVLALRRRAIDVPKDDLMELQRFAIAGPALAIIYVASLFLIPPNAALPPEFAYFIPEPLNILKTLPYRVFIWWFSLAPLGIVMMLAEPLMEWKAHRS